MWFSVHASLNTTLLCVRSCSGAVMLAMPRTNLLKKFANPRNCLSCETSLGSGQSATVEILSGSMRIPSADITWPRNLHSLFIQAHFRMLPYSPCSRMSVRHSRTFARCSALVRPRSARSSMYRIIFPAFIMGSNTRAMTSENTAGAFAHPKLSTFQW